MASDQPGIFHDLPEPFTVVRRHLRKREPEFGFDFVHHGQGFFDRNGIGLIEQGIEQATRV